MKATTKHGSWHGLFQKEWLVSKAEVMTLFILNIVIGISMPILTLKVFESSQDLSDSLSVFVSIWLLAHLFIALKILYTSVKNDMKYPDIWLHSPRSIFQLVGVKAVFAAFITLGSLVVSAVIFGLTLMTLDLVELPSLGDRVLVSLSAILTTFLISIYMMAIGFFFWSLYQVLRSRIGSIAVVATPLIFISYIYLLEKIRFPSVFDEIISFGPVKFTDTNFFDETTYNLIAVIVPNGVVFTVGGLLFYGVIAAAFFVVGSWLFEKKVRF